MASAKDSEQAEQNPNSSEEQKQQNGEQEKEVKQESVAKDGASAGNTYSSIGKIFIGGLPRETTTEALTNHFKKYGELTDSVIMKTRGSGQPRGFGFVTFADPGVCDRILQEEQIINGRVVDCKRSIPRENMDALKGPKTKKIFVGGIPTTVTEDEFAKHFSQFGKVVEHQIVVDHDNSRSRGFGFIIFDNEKNVDDLLAKGSMHDFAGKQVEIKKAEPKKAQDPKKSQEPRRALEPRRPFEFGSNAPGRIGLGSTGLGIYDRYDEGYGFDLGSDLGFGSGLYRGYGSRAGSLGGYGSSGYGGSLDVGGYGGSYLGGGYAAGMGSYGGGLGGGYQSGLLGGLNDDLYAGGLPYGSSYGGSDYGSGLGSSGGYGGGYGSTRGYAGSGTGRYHPYGRM